MNFKFSYYFLLQIDSLVWKIIEWEIQKNFCCRSLPGPVCLFSMNVFSFLAFEILRFFKEKFKNFHFRITQNIPSFEAMSEPPSVFRGAASIGKKHALKKYEQFALNTSCFLGSSFMKLHNSAVFFLYTTKNSQYWIEYYPD